MKIHYFNLLLPLLLLSGCLLESKSHTEHYEMARPENPQPFDNVQKEITVDTTKMTDFVIDQNFSEDYFITGLNKHLIYFRLPPEYSSGVQFYRWHRNTNAYERNDVKQYTTDSSVAIYSEVLDLTGLPLEVQKYTYEIFDKNGLLKKFEVEVKPDLKIRGEVFLSALNNRSVNIDVDTIYIYPGSALITDGVSVRIDAKTLVSRGGIYTDRALRENNFSGEAKGANLSLYIERLIGTLEVQVGLPSARGDNELIIHINELSRFKAAESCGISTRVLAPIKAPEVLVIKNYCTDQ